MKNACLVISVEMFITCCNTGYAAKDFASIQQSVVIHRVGGTIVVVHLAVDMVHSRTTDHKFTHVFSERDGSINMAFLPSMHSACGRSFKSL